MPLGQPSQPNRTTIDIVPASQTPASSADKPLNPMDTVDRQQTLLEAERRRNADMETRLNQLMDKERAREEQEKNKRKRDDEEEMTKKRGAVLAMGRSKLEEVEGSGVLPAEQVRQLLSTFTAQTQKATSQQELDDVANFIGPYVTGIHAASANAKDMMYEREQAKLRAINNDLMLRMTVLPQPSFVTSGGYMTQQHQQQAPPQAAALSSSAPLQNVGTVYASNNFNAFAGLSSAGRGFQATVSEVVPATRSTPAAVGVDLNAPDWGRQLTEEAIKMHGMLPSEQMLRDGGREVRTITAMSANGPVQERTLVPRRQLPYNGPIHMGIVHPDMYAKIVNGIKAHYATHGSGQSKDGTSAKLSNDIQEAINCGVHDEVQVPGQMPRRLRIDTFRNPQAGDGLMYAR